MTSSTRDSYRSLNQTDSRSSTSGSTTSAAPSGRAARFRFHGRIDLLSSHPGLSFQRVSAKGDGLPRNRVGFREVPFRNLLISRAKLRINDPCRGY